MRVLVNLFDKNIVAVLGEPEISKFTNGKIQLRNLGDILEFDDEIEYLMPYWLELRMINNLYVLRIMREDATRAVHPRCIIRFKNLTELSVIAEALERYCNTGIKITEREKQILKQHVVEQRALCSIPIHMDVYEVGKRMLMIARKLHLF